MSDLYKILVAFVLLFALIVGSWAAGYVHVKNKWNADIAVRETLQKAEKDSNKVTLETLNSQHSKDIENAKSQAGRAAVNKWLIDNRVLSDSLPVCEATGSSKANGASVPDAGSEEQEPRRSIAEFALRCAQDALIVTDWQLWAIRESLPIK